MAAVTVVGAGVSGLTTALRPGRARPRRDRRRPRPSGGHHLCGGRRAVDPYRVLPYDRVLAWSATGYTAFARLAADRPESASACAGARSCCAGARRRVVGTGRAHPGGHPRRPAGLHGGMAVPRPVVDMGEYLPWLAAEAAAAGVTLVRRPSVPTWPV